MKICEESYWHVNFNEGMIINEFIISIDASRRKVLHGRNRNGVS